MRHWVIWNAALLGFSFLSRGSELIDMMVREIGFKADARGVYITIFHRMLKTEVEAR